MSPRQFIHPHTWNMHACYSKNQMKIKPKKKLTCHRGGSSGGVSLPHNDNIHPPCLILAQCWKDKTTAFFKIPG